MLEKLRLFLVVLEEGGFRRAADRLRISQSSITRQIQSLELDLGGCVLERTSAGVRPTNGGQALAERAKTLLADYDSTMAEVRRLNRGESERLRIGYIASAVAGVSGTGSGRAAARLSEAESQNAGSNARRDDCRITAR